MPGFIFIHISFCNSLKCKIYSIVETQKINDDIEENSSCECKSYLHFCNFADVILCKVFNCHKYAWCLWGCGWGVCVGVGGWCGWGVCAWGWVGGVGGCLGDVVKVACFMI